MRNDMTKIGREDVLRWSKEMFSSTEMVERQFDESDSLGILDIIGPLQPHKMPRFWRTRNALRRVADAWGVLIGRYYASNPEDE